MDIKVNFETNETIYAQLKKQFNISNRESLKEIKECQTLLSMVNNTNALYLHESISAAKGIAIRLYLALKEEIKDLHLKVFIKGNEFDY